MKKYVFLAVMLMCLPLFFMLGAKKEAKPAKPVLIIGAECEYPPNNWEEIISSDYTLPVSNHAGYYADGYDIQIVKLIAERMNYDVRIKRIAWNDLLPSLNRGEIDAIFSSMLDTNDRRKVAAFSEPYEITVTEYGIITRRETPFSAGKTLKHFSGAKIIGERGTKFDDVIEQIPGVVHMKPVDTIKEMIDAVISGEAHGAVIDIEAGQYYELVNKPLKLVKFSGDDGFNLGFHGVCAAVRKGDSELLHRINLAIAGIDKHERQRIMDGVNSRMLNGRH